MSITVVDVEVCVESKGSETLNRVIACAKVIRESLGDLERAVIYAAGVEVIDTENGKEEIAKLLRPVLSRFVLLSPRHPYLLA